MAKNVQTNENKQEANSKYGIACVNMNDNFAICEAGSGAAVRATTTDSTATLFNAINGSGKKVAEFLGVPLEIKNIVVGSADVAKNFDEKDDEDAEKENKPCVHFFTTDGTHISSISNGIVRATKKLFEAGLQPVENAPIKIMFTTVNTRKGTAHSFELVED